MITGWDKSVKLSLEKHEKEIIVDSSCGSAVLRGAHIYAPGILAMPRYLTLDTPVSIYIDILNSCKKGSIEYSSSSKLFIGNGIIKMTREQLFNHSIKDLSGIAVFVTDTVSRLPQLNCDLFPTGWSVLQNLPSIVCSRVLDPKPGEIILDMCAAPGNKTTHIGFLMQGKGHLIAIEKIKSKIKKLEENLKNFGVDNVKTFCYDSTKAVCEFNENNSVFLGPPFSKESFDRILLDGPCSGLGQRPQFNNSISLSQLRSYVPLQRKLFSAAVKLLKCGGILVYSTCTITVSENEGIIAWALKNYQELKLVSVTDKLKLLNLDNFATFGYTIDGLAIEDSKKLCRFDFKSNTIGFFIACFQKNR